MRKVKGHNAFTFIELIVVVALSISSCLRVPVTETEISSMVSEAYFSEPVNIQPSKVLSEAEKLLSQMTLRDKIGQMFIVAPQQISDFAEHPVGGIIFFGDDIQDPEQITNLIEDKQKQSSIPLFMATDEEGGRVARIANNKSFDVQKYKSMQAVGNTGDPDNAREAGEVIGSYMKALGFNLDFAPIADVNTNPQNIVIGDRAFGSDPELVAVMVSAAIKGFRSSGIISCIKHFPGHGDTSEDTHTGGVSIDKTWDEMLICELIPFIAAIEADTDMIMMSHITAYRIDVSGLPASLSEEMTENRLRNELGYDGVIITDSMIMGAISDEFSPGEAAVMAVNAGVDIILMPQDLTAAFEALITAVESNVIPVSRIDESVIRILNLKDKYCIM